MGRPAPKLPLQPLEARPGIGPSAGWRRCPARTGCRARPDPPLRPRSRGIPCGPGTPGARWARSTIAPSVGTRAADPAVPMLPYSSSATAATTRSPRRRAADAGERLGGGHAGRQAPFHVVGAAAVEPAVCAPRRRTAPPSPRRRPYPCGRSASGSVRPRYRAVVRLRWDGPAPDSIHLHVETRRTQPARDVLGDLPLAGSAGDQGRVDRVDPHEPGEIATRSSRSTVILIPRRAARGAPTGRGPAGNLGREGAMYIDR